MILIYMIHDDNKDDTAMEYIKILELIENKYIELVGEKFEVMILGDLNTEIGLPGSWHKKFQPHLLASIILLG